MSRELLSYRAGPRALERLRRDGLGPGSIRAVFGPACGPKWLALAGLDRALLESDLLDGGRILLAGASAGAWRMLAFACPDPRRAHRRLLDGYVGQVFDRGVTPRDVSGAYRSVLAEVIDGDAGEVLDHPRHDLAIHTARSRLPTGRAGLAASLAAAAALNVVTARATDLLFERVLFHSRPAGFTLPFAGQVVALSPDNLLDAAVASGTVPLHLETVRDVAGAPRGGYVDGGLTDYHLNQAYLGDGEGLALVIHHQRALLPAWLDRYRPRRKPPSAAVANLLLIHPSPAWVAELPGGQVPDRHDFRRFADDSPERLRRWRAAVAASCALGEQLASDLESGRLAEVVEPL